MPRRRTRKTNWKPQEERRLRIRSERRGSPDPKKLSRAFIGLALARAEADARAQADATREAKPRGGTSRATDQAKGEPRHDGA